ncbi:MAG: LysR family transcriptional regulator [Pseudomonadota bacterium]
MRNWDDLRFCLALARHKKMSAAAVSLNTNVATVSRRIARVTEEIGETLFTKIGQTWTPTAKGARLIGFAEALANNLYEIDDPSDFARVSTVRVACELVLMQTYFASEMTEYLGANPEINFELSLRQASLALGEADVIISAQEPVEGNLVRKKATELRCHAYASRHFIDELDSWLYVDYGHVLGQKAFFAPRFGPQPRLRVEGLNLAKDALSHLPLVAVLPDRFAARSPDLIRFDKSDQFAQLPIWVSFHASRRNDPVIEVAKHFAFTALAGHADDRGNDTDQLERA